MTGRWATFDCYGTLIDWNRGVASVLGEELLSAYHELEPRLQAEDPSRTYREVLTLAGDRLAGRGAELAESLPGWPAFPEVRESLGELRRRGWRLAILSNTDPDYIAASKATLGVEFDETVVASEIGSYKPARGHWDAFFSRTDADRERHAHVGASVFHDIVPARELGLLPVWINRLDEPEDERAARTLRDLAPLPDTLDELVPA